MACGTPSLQDKGQAESAIRAPGRRRPVLTTSQASFCAGTGGQSKGNCSHLSAGAWDPEALSPRVPREATCPRSQYRRRSRAGTHLSSPPHHAFQNTVQLHKMLLL